MTARDISEVLNRRSDLSTFVVHLTKDHEGRTARQNLAAILATRTIKATTAMGWRGARNELTPEQLQQMRVACFSETPLEHVHTLFQEIQGRSVRLSTYGLGFTKAVARQRDINPVWYIDMTPGRVVWEIAGALDELRRQGASTGGGFAAHPASKILPFVEPMGTWSRFRRKEFSWEREWRRRGDLRFAPDDVAFVFCPERDISDFERTGEYRALDPSWSLEGMIDHLRRWQGPAQPTGSPSTPAAAASPQAHAPIVVIGQSGDVRRRSRG